MKEKLQIERAIEPGGYLVRLFGTLDEGLKRDALAGLRAEAVVFDFDQLRRVTSFGVGQWLAALKGLKASYYAFIHCRAAVVAQFNMVTHFGGQGHLVSFYTPYFCKSCDREIEVLIDLRQQHPQVAAGAPPKVTCPSCQKEAVFDDLPESYFSYARSRPAPKLPPLASRLLDIAKRQPARPRQEKEAARPPAAPGAKALPRPHQRAAEAPTTGRRIGASFNGEPKLESRLPHRTDRSARLLLLDADATHADRIALILRSAAELEIKKSLKGVSPEEWDLLLVNYDSLSGEERGQLARDFPSQKQRGRLVAYSSDPNRGDLAELLGRLGLTNFLAKNGAVDPEELYITIHKLLSQDIFGIDKYFSWGAWSMERVLRSSREKGALLEAASSFATDAGLQSRFVDMFTMVTEELVTNALYDAPTDAQGRHRFAHLSRDQEVALGKGEEITVTFCCDGRRIGISVSDPFGSLTPKKVLDYLVKCFKKGDNQVDSKQGGAGLGLYYTFESVSHLVVNAKLTRRTEVIGLLDVRGSYKEFVSRSKSLNIFVAP